ncbi:DUF1253-domain-containing protein [Durotheca rogersii]|uniref:DUF1253-domain-containing protein n=1 Tax=Durotheca rogersii TaxID=419775 RepID=UPI00221F73B8|nr:DUF1253-domain-containing protein [Durotheca rogersii]KAI5857340.1 DUF1253-domain-containing protein [Durotheca rogersii]
MARMRDLARRGAPPRGRAAKMHGKRPHRVAPKFESARLTDVRHVENGVSDEREEPRAESVSEGEVSGSGDEEELQPTNRPYFALMQSLEKEVAPRAKRRKLNHQPEEDMSSTKPEKETAAAGEDDGDGEERDIDHVWEAEQHSDNEAMTDDDDDNDDDNDAPDSSDPFEAHFVNPDQDELQRRLGRIEVGEYSQSNSLQAGWRAITSLPGSDPALFAQLAPSIPGPPGLKLKHRLAAAANRKCPTFDELEKVLYPPTFAYRDVLFCGRTTQNAESLRRMACLHIVNHVFKTRSKVIKNSAKLAKEGENGDFEPRDQGFTRPKVLMVLPTRNSAAKMIEMICDLCEPEQQENRKRFDDSYLDSEAKFSADRPEDFRELFAGNDDDMFRIGIKFTRKTIKYFAQFYNSDILVASPLGLRMAIGSEEGGREEQRRRRKGSAAVDFDFLSSIEVVVFDQADALLMQNWEHVEFVLDHLNRQPREAHNCDFSRVREWYLDGRAAHFRQTLVFSAFHTPELAELHRRHAQNWEGRVRVQPGSYAGVIDDLGSVKVRQTFSRFAASSAAAEPDARFQYFTSAALPSLLKKYHHRDGHDGGGAGTLIFVPSYLDFVRVRNYLATSAATAHVAFGALSEYVGVGAASRARSHFASGRHQLLLYSGRAHHFHRYAVLRGVRRIIMYGLPDDPRFYREIVGNYLARSERDLLLEPGRGTVRVLFSRYDILRLERVVGTARVGRMVHEKGDTFDFV